ncbi:hypothetical protein [Litorilituus sediminis]|uniref:Uncharacterized protein n=1 Tax=Litorilituus sediminis TaxID=718192 RepID=A0A4P6P1U6_9GAMM|nr:hypothetical protein [Litorilituus sediminis]QBG35053.1 hypothetical protein EMK97_04540 [Litorilituus sediminis]
MAKEPKHLFDNPNNVKRLLSAFYLCCALLLIIDFFVHRHISHSWENLLGFYPLYGFVGCVLLVFVATWLRTLLMRSEDYYQAEQNHTETDSSLPAKKIGAKHVDD